MLRLRALVLLSSFLFNGLSFASEAQKNYQYLINHKHSLKECISRIGAIGAKGRRDLHWEILGNRKDFKNQFPAEHRVVLAALSMINSFRYANNGTDFLDFLDSGSGYVGLYSPISCNQFVQAALYLANIFPDEKTKEAFLKPINIPSEEAYFNAWNKVGEEKGLWKSYMRGMSDEDLQKASLAMHASIYRNLGRNHAEPTYINSEESIISFLQERKSLVGLLYFSEEKGTPIKQVALVFLNPGNQKPRYIHINRRINEVNETALEDAAAYPPEVDEYGDIIDEEEGTKVPLYRFVDISLIRGVSDQL